VDALVLNSDALPLSVVPLSVIPWEEAIVLAYKDAVDVLHVYENWVVHSPSQTMHVPAVIMTRDWVNVGRHLKFSKANVYLRDEYVCQYCHETFEVSRLTIDHVVPRHAGGKTTWMNVAAACDECNPKKGHRLDMHPLRKPWKPTYYELVEKRKKFPMRISHPSWNFYLGWPADKLVLPKKAGAKAA
jgi:5-methylcytosine-specific restriction endonuclease McrA